LREEKIEQKHALKQLASSGFTINN